LQNSPFINPTTKESNRQRLKTWLGLCERLCDSALEVIDSFESSLQEDGVPARLGNSFLFDTGVTQLVDESQIKAFEMLFNPNAGAPTVRNLVAIVAQLKTLDEMLLSRKQKVKMIEVFECSFVLTSFLS
jgi:hypothetical protein